jgi:muramidase (phage lysozyme)
MDNPVQEIIEDILLKLLGLESEFEMSYEEYIRHLREAMVAARMNKSSFSSEEAELITDEWKRVKSKKGRFTIKVKRTTVKNKPLKNNRALNFIRPQKQKLLAGKPEKIPQEEESLLKIVSDIRTTVDSIYNSLLNLVTITARNSELSRRRGESGRRQKREEGLESKIGKIGGMISKVLTPVQGILDKIFRFIAFTLLGKAVGAFFKWMEDPENKKKFKSLIRFFTDHWPLFVGAFVLFGTSFGSFVRGMLKVVAKGLIALAFNIPKIKNFLRKNPRLAMLGLGAATLGTGLIANTLNPPEAKSAGDDLKDVGKSDFDKASKDAQSASNIKIPTYKMGGSLPKISLNVNGGQQNQGSMKMFDGLVGNNGIPFTGGGKDNRLFPTANGGAVGLNGREFIVNEGGVKLAGIPFLETINRIGGGSGANKPKMISSNNIKINGASGGGNLNVRAFAGGGFLSGIGNMLGGFGKSSGIGNVFRGFGPRPAGATQSKPKINIPTPEHKLPEVQAALRSIKVAEGTAKSKNSYDTLFGFGTAPIRQMTVAEVINMQNTDRLPKRLGGGTVGFGRGKNGKVRSAASGAYQFMPVTLQQVMNLGALKSTDLMNPDNQDKAAWALMKYRGVTLKSLQSGGLSRSTMNLMAPEWASFPTPSGKSYYGQPVKKHEELQKVYGDTLKQLRLGNQSRAQPPGPPERGQMKRIMLPGINLPPQYVGSNNANDTGLADNDMRTSPHSSSSASVRSEVMGILGVA